MSLSKLVTALEGLGLSTSAVIDSIAYIGTVHLGADLAVVSDDSAPQKKTAAQRAKEYRERKASRCVMPASHDGVTGHDDGVTGHDDGVTASHEASHAVTPPASARALSSASSSENLKERESTGASASREATATVTRPVTQTVTQTVTRANSEERVTKNAGGDLMARAEAVRIALTDGFKRHGVILPTRHLSVPHSQPVIDIARSVEPADLPRLIEGFFADAATMAKGYPIAWLANNPAQYMPKPSASAAPTTVGRPPTLTEHEHHALNREAELLSGVSTGRKRPPPDPVHLQSAKAKMAAAQQAMAS